MASRVNRPVVSSDKSPPAPSPKASPAKTARGAKRAAGKPGGREKPPEARRDLKLQVRVTPSEYERFQRAASAEHFGNVSAWARRVLLRVLNEGER